MKPKLLLVIFVCAFALPIACLPAVYASLTCEGSGQVFFYPELLTKETISIPCSISTSTPVNVSCVSLILHNNDLVSATPSIEDVDWYGKTIFMEIESYTIKETFVVTFRNRDLFQETSFDWKVICAEEGGIFHTTSGTFTSEMPISEPVLTSTMAVFRRDVNHLLGLGFVLLILVIFIVIFVKMVLNK